MHYAVLLHTVLQNLWETYPAWKTNIYYNVYGSVP